MRVPTVALAVLLTMSAAGTNTDTARYCTDKGEGGTVLTIVEDGPMVTIHMGDRYREYAVTTTGHLVPITDTNPGGQYTLMFRANGSVDVDSEGKRVHRLYPCTNDGTPYQ